MAAAVSKLLRKAARHLEKGERCEAEALYADILVKFPKNRTALLGREKSQQAPASKLCDPPKETFDEVITSHRQGEFEKVLTRVEPLLQVITSALVLFHLQGASNVALGRYEAGIDSYQKALKINPDHADTYNNMEEALRRKGDFKAAIDSFKNALKIIPDYAGAHYNMGTALKDKGEFDASIRSYRQTLKAQPNHAGAYYNMGNIFKEKHEFDTAIDSYKQVLKARPDYAEAYSNIGVALMEREEFDTAIANQRKALEIKPDYAWAHYHLGRAVHESEDFYGAVESFKQALHFAPDTVEILSSLDILLRRMAV